MAGSRKNFLYTDDSATIYAIALDESNTEAINGDTGDIPSTSTSVVGLPKNIKPREVFYANPDRSRTIRCIPLTQAIYQAIVAGTTSQTIEDPLGGVAAGTLSLIRLNGERRRVYPGTDTGLIDGDVT